MSVLLSIFISLKIMPVLLSIIELLLLFLCFYQSERQHLYQYDAF